MAGQTKAQLVFRCTRCGGAMYEDMPDPIKSPRVTLHEAAMDPSDRVRIHHCYEYDYGIARLIGLSYVPA